MLFTCRQCRALLVVLSSHLTYSPPTPTFQWDKPIKRRGRGRVHIRYPALLAASPHSSAYSHSFTQAVPNQLVATGHCRLPHDLLASGRLSRAFVFSARGCTHARFCFLILHTPREVIDGASLDSLFELVATDGCTSLIRLKLAPSACSSSK